MKSHLEPDSDIELICTYELIKNVNKITVDENDQSIKNIVHIKILKNNCPENKQLIHKC